MIQVARLRYGEDIRVMKKLVWMFSGQGSQYYRMGIDLFEADADFRREVERCDCHLQEILRISLTDMLYSPTTAHRFTGFDRTLHTHPALFCIQYSLAQALLAKGVRPDLLLGYSLGEIVAAALARVLTFETALALVVDQARLLEAYAGPGGMMAILAASSIVEQRPRLFHGVSVAAYNFAGNFVVSGDSGAISRIRQELERSSVICQELPVRLPFHSPGIDPASAPFLERCRKLSFRKPDVPIVSASEAAVLTDVPGDLPWRAVRVPVRFQQTMEMLDRQGEWQFVDLGPSGTMASLVRYSLPSASGSSFQAIMTPFNQGLMNLQRVLDGCAH